MNKITIPLIMLFTLLIAGCVSSAAKYEFDSRFDANMNAKFNIQATQFANSDAGRGLTEGALHAWMESDAGKHAAGDAIRSYIRDVRITLMGIATTLLVAAGWVTREQQHKFNRLVQNGLGKDK